MKKNINVFEKDREGNSSHEYTIKVNKNEKRERFKLYFSDNENWRNSTKGKLILTLTDDKNHLIFDFNEMIDLKKLEYDEAYYILMVLKYLKLGPKIKFKNG